MNDTLQSPARTVEARTDAKHADVAVVGLGYIGLPTATMFASKGKRVLGSVLFVPHGRGVAIELGPLRALGWTEQTYPFPEDTTAAGGLEPLLLPWSERGPRRYVYRGGSFIADAP